MLHKLICSGGYDSYGQGGGRQGNEQSFGGPRSGGGGFDNYNDRGPPGGSRGRGKGRAESGDFQSAGSYGSSGYAAPAVDGPASECKACINSLLHLSTKQPHSAFSAYDHSIQLCTNYMGNLACSYVAECPAHEQCCILKFVLVFVQTAVLSVARIAIRDSSHPPASLSAWLLLTPVSCHAALAAKGDH